MRTPWIRHIYISAALACAACSGRIAVLDEPLETDDPTANAGASGTGGRGQSGGGGETGGTDATPIGNDGSCNLDQWRPGNKTTARPLDCGVCGCKNGEVVCQERPCLPTRAVVECPSDYWRLLETVMTFDSAIVGDKLHAEVMGPGGCGGDDYLTCYYAGPSPDPFNPMYLSYPVNIYTARAAEDCATVAFQTFDVDLTPLADKLTPGSGLVDVDAIRLGYATLGELTCSDRSTLAAQEVMLAGRRISGWGGPEILGKTCQSNSDCVASWVFSSCFSEDARNASCGFVGFNQQAAAEFEQEVQTINATTCQAYFDAGCTPVRTVEPPCSDNTPLAAQCIEGFCQASQVLSE